MDLVEQVYKITKEFPQDEMYGLVSQRRRAAVSLPSKIVEGPSRSTPEFLRYLSISYGSLSELETQMMIASRLGSVKELELDRLTQRASEVGCLIHGLSRSIEKLATGHRPLLPNEFFHC
jgi:four helix bundle protein